MNKVNSREGSSSARLLGAGKRLIARNGYERTSTAAIVREAGTSESQLVRNFGGKAGLLKVIFEENWKPLNVALRRLLDEAGDSREALNQVFDIFINSLNRDREMARLFLFEGRRLRGYRQEVTLSEGFIEFFGLLQELVVRGQRQGAINAALNPQAICSGLIGVGEGMVRDRLILSELRVHPLFSEADLRALFSVLVDGLHGKPPPPA